MKTRYFLLMFLLMFLLIQCTSGAWLTDWTYRKEFTVTNSVSSALTNYQQQFTVYRTTGTDANYTVYVDDLCQEDYDDIRFTASDGTTLLDYYIISSTAGSATIWIEMDSIAASGTTTFYIYYGNPVASTYSNADNTFVFFDHFLVPSTSVNTSKWLTQLGSPSVSSSILTLSTPTGGRDAITSTIPLFTPNMSLYTYAKMEHTSNAGNQLISGTNYTLNQRITLIHNWPTAGGRNNLYVYTAAASSTNWLNGGTSYYTYNINRNQTTAFVLRDGVQVGSTITSNVPLCILNLTIDSETDASGNILVDWIFIKNYIYPEPVVTAWGAEEGLEYVYWSQDEYNVGEDGVVNTIFPSAYWDTTNYTYYAHIYRSTDLSTSLDTWNIVSQTQTHTVTDMSEFDVGTYYVFVYMEDVGTGEIYVIDYDTTDIINSIIFHGYTHNATSSAIIDTVNISVYSSGTFHFNDSTAAGYYQTDYLSVGQSIWFNASKTGYENNDQSIYVSGAANVSKNVSLVPDTESVYWVYANNGTSIGGLITTFPYYDIAEGATITLENTTWNETQTIGVSGWYQFNGLANTSVYNLTGVLYGYTDLDEDITSGDDNFTRADYTFDTNLTLIVNILDAASGSILTESVDVRLLETLNGTVDETITTTTGTATFSDLSASYYVVTASCIGYAQGTEYVNLDVSKTITISLSSQTTNGSYYTPHHVEMVIQDKYGNPIPDTIITCVPIGTTISVDWLTLLLGIPSSAEIDTTPLIGTCGYDGGCTFLMVPEIIYEVDIINTVEGVNETLNLAPKDDLYVFTVDTTSTAVANTTSTAGINWTLTNTTINATHENLTFTFSDPSNLTSNLSFWVKTQTSPITTCYQTYCSNPCSASESYIIESTAGTGVIWGFDAVNPEFGNFTDSATITFRKLVDLGIASYYYGWIAAAFLIVLGGFFSVINVRFGAIIIPCFAYFMWWMEWITLGATTAAILGVLLIVAVISYIRKSENKQ